MIGKSHLQTIQDGEPGLGPHPIGEGPLANATRDDTFYGHEEPSFWPRKEGTDLPHPYYGFDHVDLVIHHGDANFGHYEEWLRQQVPNLDSLRGAKNQMPHDYTVPQAVRTRVPEELYSTSYIRDRAIDYLSDRTRKDKPFFAFVSFPDPHHPFNPPGKYWDMYSPEDMAVPPSFNAHKNPPPTLKWARKQFEQGTAVTNSQTSFMASAEHIREAMALTCGMIAMVDDAVGAILDCLDKAGLKENTVVIFNTDHGDFMGDHGLLLKGPMHFHGLIRVPFLWNDPERKTVPTTDYLSGTVDVARTILARAGLTPYWGIQGTDLAPVLSGERGPAPGDVMLVEDEGNRLAMLGFSEQLRLRTLVTDRYRMSVYLDQDWGELYDLEEDPHETYNLWHDAAARGVRAELTHRMMHELMRVVDRSPWPKRRA